MTGNLSYQIEHHLFPDLPSNRYSEVAPAVRALCEEYGLPYTSGPLLTQTWQTWRKVLRYSLPGGERVATAVTTRDEPAALPVGATSAA
jgi:linoleoyl-CoA desaturase